MVHISDGILSLPVLAVGWMVTLLLIAAALWWSKRKGNMVEEIPKLSVVTAAFFVASLIHIPVGPTSVHLILNGLVGVTLGMLSYPAIFIGLVLQAFLFGHGGVTVIGVNTLDMGIPALIAYGIFKLGKLNIKSLAPKLWLLGAIAGGVAVTLAVLFTAAMLLTLGEEYAWVAKALVVYHIPVIAIESFIVGSVVAFLARVKPELLNLEVEK
ncbi:cobalt transporter CbiM [Archaeoglobales archaeon]|nr:MAG: cobalt transporter CbiM [Archaeoglobales archaeon]